MDLLLISSNSFRTLLPNTEPVFIGVTFHKPARHEDDEPTDNRNEEKERIVSRHTDVMIAFDSQTHLDINEGSEDIATTLLDISGKGAIT